MDPDDLPTQGPPRSFDEIAMWQAWAPWAATQQLISDRVCHEIMYGYDKLRITMKDARKIEERVKALVERNKGR